MGFKERLGILLLIFGTASAPASADTVQVTGGALTWDLSESFNPRLEVTGERGLAINVGIDRVLGGLWPIEFCYLTPCFPGDTLSLLVEKFGDSLGVASIDGQTFPVNMVLEDSGGLNIRIDGSLLVPDFTGEPSASASAPFVFSGLLLFPAPLGVPYPPPVALAGRGIATLQFARPHPDLPTGWQLQNMRYEFSDASAVPEPTTLVLVGSGVAGLILRGRRSRSR